MFNLTKLMLANTMMIGVIMTISTNNWVTMWMGLEISLLSMMPFMQNKSKLSSECMMKYFIMQSVASTMLIVSVISLLIGVNMMNEMTLTMSLLIKLGLAPFHSWVIMIVEGMGYLCLLNLLTLMKLPALTILYQANSSFIMLPMMMSLMISSISSINQSSIKKTLGYSSIYNISMVTTLINKANMMMMFMSIYSMMMLLLTMTLLKNKISFINQIMSNEFNNWIKINLWINMLSLGGFPPMMGFLVKLIVIQNLIMNSESIILLMIILTSVLVSFFYMRIVFSSMFNSNTHKKWMMNISSNSYFLMTINLLITPLLLSATSIT